MKKIKRRKVKKSAPKKKFETIATRKTIIILTIVGAFLIGLLIVNALVSFRKMETRECVEKMVFFEEMMRNMAADFKFAFPPDTEDNHIIRALVVYYLYGRDAFDPEADKYLRLKSREDIEKLESQNVSPFRNFKCSAGGEYLLLASKKKGLYDIKCTKHGILKQPNEEGQYEFSGDIFALSPNQGSLGWEARLYLKKELNLGKEYVMIIAAPQEQPVEEK